jgi:hypothetical protein
MFPGYITKASFLALFTNYVVQYFNLELISITKQYSEKNVSLYM